MHTREAVLDELLRNVGKPVALTPGALTRRNFYFLPDLIEHVAGTLSHSPGQLAVGIAVESAPAGDWSGPCYLRELERSEEHTSELQSRLHLVCRLLLEKKKKKSDTHH